VSSTCPGAGAAELHGALSAVRCLDSRVHDFDASLIMRKDSGHGARALSRGARFAGTEPPTVLSTIPTIVLGAPSSSHTEPRISFKGEMRVAVKGKSSPWPLKPAASLSLHGLDFRGSPPVWARRLSLTLAWPLGGLSVGHSACRQQASGARRELPGAASKLLWAVKEISPACSLEGQMLKLKL